MKKWGIIFTLKMILKSFKITYFFLYLVELLGRRIIIIKKKEIIELKTKKKRYCVANNDIIHAHAHTQPCEIRENNNIEREVTVILCLNRINICDNPSDDAADKC